MEVLVDSLVVINSTKWYIMVHFEVLQLVT